MINKIRFLNIDILSITKKNLLENIKEGVLFTPNLDHLVKLQNDKEFYNVYKKADWITCDSRILFFCSKILKKSFPEAIPGSSFFRDFYTYHKNNEECKIFLLGAAEGVAESAKLKINRRIGREIIVGAHSPSFGFEKNENECNEIVNLINMTQANVLLVGVGAPKQEKWIIKYRSSFKNIRLFFALGATIDFEAGNLSRAPKIFQLIGMEWMYRLIKEPRRLWKRYLIDDMFFFWLFFKQLIGKYTNPFNDNR